MKNAKQTIEKAINIRVDLFDSNHPDLQESLDVYQQIQKNEVISKLR